ncbi:tRNA lysidine(34) synthetase TilS [Silanimonas algicola]
MDLTPFPADAPRRLLVGFSGGRDSTALMHRLSAIPAPPWTGLRAVHVDHGLHVDAARWAAHCEAQAARMGMDCVVRRVAVAARGGGLEDAARRARYAAFAAERQADECLVLAHHRDDQAETLLLALLRGSGERGLSGMREFTVDARGPIWRPLLRTPAQAVAQYAARFGLDWIDDPSNRDERLSRNHLRRTVLPLLRRQWPQVDASLAHSAQRLAEADDLLRAQARKDVATLLGLRGDVLDAKALRALPAPRGTRALRSWAETQGARLTTDVVERVLGEWSRQPPGRVLAHALGDAMLRQWGDRLWLTPRDAAGGSGASRSPDAAAWASVPWDGRSPLRLPFPPREGRQGTLTLLGAEAFDQPMALVPRSAAPPRFLAAGARHSHPLKAHFVRLGLPPWERDAVPLLVDGDGRLQALGDLAYGASLEAWLRARGARLLWQPGEPPG